MRVSVSAIGKFGRQKNTAGCLLSLSPFLSPTVAYIGLGRGGARGEREGEIWVFPECDISPRTIYGGEREKGKKGRVIF